MRPNRSTCWLPASASSPGHSCGLRCCRWKRCWQAFRRAPDRRGLPHTSQVRYSIGQVDLSGGDRPRFDRAMDGDLGAVIRNAIQAQGIHVFEKILENGFREITTSTKPIRNVADLAGLKIRVSPGKIRIDTFQSLGASPAPIALSELYTSLQTHVVDAQENPLLLIEQQKFYEVQKYNTLVARNVSRFGASVAVSMAVCRRISV